MNIMQDSCLIVSQLLPDFEVMTVGHWSAEWRS